MAKKAKKRGVKPGTKRGPYKRPSISNDGLDVLANQLKEAIKARIKILNVMLKRL